MADTLLIARRTRETESYWNALMERDQGELPAPLRPLVAGETEIRCERTAAVAVFDWGRRQPEWQDDPFPFFVRDAEWEWSQN